MAEDDCGNFVYVRAASGEVMFWDHEIENGDVFLADDISGFLKLLRPFDPVAVKLAPGQVKSVWIDPTFKPEF